MVEHIGAEHTKWVVVLVLVVVVVVVVMVLVIMLILVKKTLLFFADKNLSCLVKGDC